MIKEFIKWLGMEFWGLVWNVSESLKINLGWLAPHVFGWMLGAKKKRIK